MNMDTMNQTRNLIITVVIIGAVLFCLFIIPAGVAALLTVSRLDYIMPVMLATGTFSITMILAIRQKRISLGSALGFLTGLLFLISGAIEFGYSGFTQTIHDQMEFSGSLHPEQISRGFTILGMGLACLLTYHANIKSNSVAAESFRQQRYKIVRITMIAAGIFFLFFGMYMVINGFQPRF